MTSSNSSDDHAIPSLKPAHSADTSVDPLGHAQLFAEAARELDEVPVGAVILNSVGQVIGVGHNRREVDQDPTAHAEIIAIRDAAQRIKSWRLEDCTLYVTLEPCPMCLGAIQQARISKVIYGAKDPKGGALSLGYTLHQDSRTNHRFAVEEEIRSECGKILSDFFKEKRRKNTLLKAPNSDDSTNPQIEGTEPP